MVLPESLEELEKLYAVSIDAIFNKSGLPNNFTQLESKVNSIVSDTTLSRLYNPEKRKDAPKGDRRRKEYVKLIPLLQDMLDEKPASEPPLLLPVRERGESRTLLIYYWDWNTQYDSHTKGKVVQGRLELPVNWHAGVADVVLHDQTNLTGNAWPKPSTAGGVDISVSVSSENQPDLFVLFHVPQTLALCTVYEADQEAAAPNGLSDVLVGSFITTNIGVKHIPIPMHGTVYLRNQSTHTDDDTYQRICLSLYHQTTLIRAAHTFPTQAEQAFQFYRENLAGKVFEGYFLHLREQRLRHFKLTVTPNGYIRIAYEKHKEQSGAYSLLHAKILCFDIDYKATWKDYCYRMQFSRHLEDGWFLGVCTGHEEVFMNRVAMRPVSTNWDDTSVDPPVSLIADNWLALRSVYNKHPVLEDYLSGSSGKIPNNERLSETPYILTQAGLLTTNEDEQSGQEYTGTVFPGDYRLYSLSRQSETTEDYESNEWYSIVQLPLRIHYNGRLELKGEQRNYYGWAKRDGYKLVLSFNERLEDDQTSTEPAHLTFYIRIEETDNGHAIKRISLGVSSRFINDLPEARTELLVRQEVNTFAQDTFEAYPYFTPKWQKFHKQTNTRKISTYLSGRLNRLIAPHHIKDVPEGRQRDFKFLFAHAALSFLPTDANSTPQLTEQFISYFYQAVLHNFAQNLSGKQRLSEEEKEEQELYERLYTYFRQIYPTHHKLWKPVLQQHAKELSRYLVKVSNVQNM